jgi:hypothetical protein
MSVGDDQHIAVDSESALAESKLSSKRLTSILDFSRPEQFKFLQD